jgi:hypothetical protein
MSSYNTALVQSMVANGATGSREFNDSLYPRIVANPQAIATILKSKREHLPIPAELLTASVLDTLDAMKQMIESNMSLVVYRVESYVRAFPTLSHLTDDMTSEGFVGLTTAVNKMAEQGAVEKPHPTSYMTDWITYHIGTVADKETAMGSSGKTVRRKRDDGKALPLHVSLPKNLEMETYEDDGIRLFELRDEILGCCESDEDRMIVDMREKGYVDNDIAKTLGLPYTTVYLLRRELYARFLTKTGMKGEV